MTFSGFGAYQLDAGGTWTLAATTVLGAYQSLTDFAQVDDGITLGSSSATLGVGAGASFSGPVYGGGGTLELVSGAGTITGLGATGTLSGSEAMTFSGFGDYVVGGGGSLTLTGTNSEALLVNGSLTNLGVVTFAAGVVLTLGAGGAVTNGSTADTTALIYGAYALYATGAAMVTNYGTVTAVSAGIVLAAGGTVINGDAADTGALIEGQQVAVGVTGAAGTVINYGTIIGGSFQRSAINLDDGGSVTNGGATDTTALIQGGYTYGVCALGGAAIVTNFGDLSGVIGVFMKAGGTVTNGSASDHTALISGAVGIDAVGPDAVTVTNFGAIVGRNGAAVRFESSSDVFIAEAGSSITDVVGGGGGTLELGSGSGTITGLGVLAKVSGGQAGTFAGFGAYVTESGTSFTFIGANLLAAGQSLTVGGSATNVGVIDAAGEAVVLTAAASLDNASATALISGLDGVYANGAAAVDNSGTLLALGTSYKDAGVDLYAGGSVTNGSVHNTTALIQAVAGGTGVLMATGPGSVANYGAVSGSYGVLLADGGAISNGSSLDTGALILGSSLGVLIGGGAGTVANHGTISGGVGLYGGGTVTNGSASDTRALIQGSVAVYNDRANGVLINGVGTVNNFGTVVALLTGVYLRNGRAGGGAVTNGSSTDTSAQISSVLSDGAATVTNFGTIGAVSSGYGGQMITNGSAVDTHALIENGNIGIDVFDYVGGQGGPDTLNNFGTILSTDSIDTAVFANNSTFTNGSRGDTVALIDGYNGVGLYFVNNDTVTNFGSVVGFGEKAAGVCLGDSTITNGGVGDSVALIKGYYGVQVRSGYGYTTVTNYGTIAGTGAAVRFGSATNQLNVEAGSKFIGAVIGGGSTLVLASGAGLVSTDQADGGMNETVSGSMAKTLFTNFATVEVAAGATFTVSGGDGVVGAGQSLAAAGGVLVLAGAITGAGVIAAGAGGTLEVDAAAASTLTMMFTGANATLGLASPSIFAATIDGFAATDVIDLVHAKATSATLGAGDVLTIMDGSHLVATLQLAGSYTGDTFSVGSDHGVGTDVTVNAPGLWPVAAAPAPHKSAPAATASAGHGTAVATLAALAANGATLTAHGLVQAMAASAAPASAAGHGGSALATAAPFDPKAAYALGISRDWR